MQNNVGLLYLFFRAYPAELFFVAYPMRAHSILNLVYVLATPGLPYCSATTRLLPLLLYVNGRCLA